MRESMYMEDEEEEEETLVGLVEHRTKQVEHLRTRVAYYNSKLHQAEKKLEETQSKLARLRGVNGRRGGCALAIQNVLQEEQHVIKTHLDDYEEEEEEEEDCKVIERKPKPLLIIPPKINPFLPPLLTKKKKKKEKEKEKERGTKRKAEEEKALIEMVCSFSSPSCCKINCETSNSHLIPSQHKRKLRSLVLSPTDDQHFVTSALDGFVNLWQIHGSHANLVSSINAVSLTQRRWPEDVAWHPNGGSLVAVYSADSGDSQLAILDLNNKKEEVVFMGDKPHVKGVINNVMFMPWDDSCFSTCGNDHAVVLWTAKHHNYWKPEVLHASLHSSAVMGVAGMQQKRMVISVGADKRIIGFDLQSEVADYKHQMESKCMSVLPNPRDQNLFMVQTSAPQRQLRLFDMRLKVSQVHEFGWNQESSTSQSALINQAWSPDGLYLTSGSADPMIHIFDIRYNGSQPSLSIKAHKKRVFKAAWHNSLPLLISISSDLNIGFHNITR